jgi:hypothetical protein
MDGTPPYLKVAQTRRARFWRPMGARSLKRPPVTPGPLFQAASVRPPNPRPRSRGSRPRVHRGVSALNGEAEWTGQLGEPGPVGRERPLGGHIPNSRRPQHWRGPASASFTDWGFRAQTFGAGRSGAGQQPEQRSSSHGILLSVDHLRAVGANLVRSKLRDFWAKILDGI